MKKKGNGSQRAAAEKRFAPLEKSVEEEIAAYIDECMAEGECLCAERYEASEPVAAPLRFATYGAGDLEDEWLCDERYEAPELGAAPLPIAAYGAGNLEDELDDVEESFAEALFRLIDERGMSDAECYKKAHIDRKTFSKIRTLKDYKPRKTTAAAFAIALKLPLDEAKDLIEKAGYSLTHSSKFDIILEYFIKKGKYDIFEINEALYAFGEKILGS